MIETMALVSVLLGNGHRCSEGCNGTGLDSHSTHGLDHDHATYNGADSFTASSVTFLAVRYSPTHRECVAIPADGSGE